MRSLLLLVWAFVPASIFAQLTVEVTTFSTLCAGSPTGMAVLAPQGAVGEVTYSTNFNLESLPAGDYTFGATDEANNEATVTFTILDRPELCGCVYPQAFNYDPQAQVDNGSCVFATDQNSCIADIVPDGVVGTNDLLQLLVEFGVVCE